MRDISSSILIRLPAVPVASTYYQYDDNPINYCPHQSTLPLLHHREANITNTLNALNQRANSILPTLSITAFLLHSLRHR